jgi:hypothetical protein
MLNLLFHGYLEIGTRQECAEIFLEYIYIREAKVEKTKRRYWLLINQCNSGIKTLHYCEACTFQT